MILIDSVNGHIQVPWRIIFLVQDIISLALCCTTVSFSHVVHREANFVTDESDGYVLDIIVLTRIILFLSVQ